MVRTKRKIPKNWTKYNPVGQLIDKTRFIIFKTPLNLELLSQLPKSQHFTTLHLMHTLALRNQRLGMVIDLTDTTRYYDRDEFEGMCIQYHKIFCSGRGFIDRDETTLKFYSCIDKFIKENEDQELLIGVHCTNGVNRSSYLICRFLIEKLGWSSHEAIDAVEKARGYPIEKGAYVQALHRAAKDARYKKGSDSEESEESQRRRKKEKKKRKQKDESDSQEVMQEFLSQFVQQAAAASTSEHSGDFSPSLTNAQIPPPSEDYEDLEGSPYDAEDGAEEDDDAGGDEMSKAKKRRLRKRKNEEMFKVMKRGNFHQIQEVIQKRFGGE